MAAPAERAPANDAAIQRFSRNFGTDLEGRTPNENISRYRQEYFGIFRCEIYLLSGSNFYIIWKQNVIIL